MSRKATTLGRLWRLTEGEGLRAQLLRGGAGSLVIQVVNLGIALGLAVLLARTLGPAGYGIYAYVFALVTVLAIPAQFGLPQLLVRETAKAQAHKRWGVMRGVWRWAMSTAAVLSLALTAITGGVAWLFADQFTSLQLATLAWGLALMPLMTVGALRDAALRGLRRVVQGQLASLVIRPGLLLVLVGAIVLTGAELTPDYAMALHAAAAAIAFLVGMWLLYRARPAPLASRPEPVYEVRQWLVSVLPLAFTAGMHLITKHVDILMLGVFTSAEDVGVYRVVAQGATLVAFGLHAMNMVVAPHFARLYAEHDLARLQRLVTSSARVILLLTLPVVALFVLLGEPLLGIVFGAEYAVGYVALAILAVGQLVNATFGSVANLLNMTGHERDTARGVAIGAVANILLNLALIPPFGIEGAAIATATSLILWNVLLWHSVRRKVGINSLAFGGAP